MISQSLLPEIGHEYAGTRKLLERVPFDHFAWKPHEKSMTLEKLATHVATIPRWAKIILTTDELDFAKGFLPSEKFTTPQEMLDSFDGHAAAAKEWIAKTTDEEFVKPWTLKRGEQVFFTLPKAGVLRSFAISHIIHHRAQLQVYLRMLNVPVTGFYGPSADEV